MSRHGVHLQRRSDRRGPLHLHSPWPLLPEVVQHHTCQNWDPLHLASQ